MLKIPIEPSEEQIGIQMSPIETIALIPINFKKSKKMS